MSPATFNATRPLTVTCALPCLALLKPKAKSLTHGTESFFNAPLFHCAADQPFCLVLCYLDFGCEDGFYVLR